MSASVTMVPLHAAPPRPTPAAARAMGQMEAVLTTAGYVPHVDEGGWSIDARLYTARAWENGYPVGVGAPTAAVCLRMHQPAGDFLCWLVEFPARTPTEWELPDHTRATRHLAILGAATYAPHPHDLSLVDYLATQVQEGNT